MKEIIGLLTEMKLLAGQIDAHEAVRVQMIADAQRFGSTASQIGDIVANANDVIADLIAKYRAKSKEQFELLRKFEIRDRKPIEDKPIQRPYFALSSHNSQIDSERFQNSAA